MKICTLILLLSFNLLYHPVFCQYSQQVKVSVDKNTGDYMINSISMRWNFKGSVKHNLTSIQNKEGRDSIGNFKEISFTWKDIDSYKASIRSYIDLHSVLFSIELPRLPTTPLPAFPSFTTFPAMAHSFSFNDDNFAPPQFKLNETSTPWLFFNDNMDAFIISPASDFIVSKMTGDGKNIISSDLNKGLTNLPLNFKHSTLLVTGKGIQHTWNEWGSTLRKSYHRHLPANDADPVLKYFGYWTDNGADYYYNYDLNKGYSSTLLELQKKYKEEYIPLGYMQLDSWWYEKSIYDYDGKPIADHKNKNLPTGMWNRYGGLMSYTADSFLFPHGLVAFEQELGLPLVTHNRWVDPTSPYHDKYNISGFAAIDPKFWTTIIDPIQKAGVVCYEQDWLNYIYNRSPKMATDPAIGNAFTDNMSLACKQAGMTMQYCMAMPRHFLQGIKYNNLTTIRTCGDRFEPAKWKSFLYTSQLGYQIGAWPWCDVFKSDELGNMVLAVLSAGVVGTGDAIGKENKDNILKACRADAILVKPDAPLLPVDKDYLDDAQEKELPMLAYTFTTHSGIKTNYVFAFTNSKNGSKDIYFKPTDLGIAGKIVVYDPLHKKIKLLNANEEFHDQLPDELYKYYILAPVTPSGIAFLGDEGKIAATGKKRIAEIKNQPGGIQVNVSFAETESSVVLSGYSDKPVTVDKGKVSFNADTHIFMITLPSGNMRNVVVNIKIIN